MPKKKVDHKIVILGDSHARGLSSNVRNNLDDNYTVCGLVKPGANTATLISSRIADVNSLTKNDLIILWGGSNDVSKNNSQEGLKHLVHFVQSNNHSNIILLCAPTRHDLPEWSCVNNEIKAFNRKLSKLVKPYKHVLIVTADTDRKFFTGHGLHLNNLGKEDIASKVSMAVTSIFQKQNVITHLCWKNGYDISVKSVTIKLKTKVLQMQMATQQTPPSHYRQTPKPTKQHQRIWKLQLLLHPQMKNPECPKGRKQPQQQK